MEGEARLWRAASASCVGLNPEAPVLHSPVGLKGLSLHKVKESFQNAEESHCKLPK